MDDDLNTAGAIGLVFEKVKEMNRLLDSQGDRPGDSVINQLEDDRHHLFLAAQILGLLEESPEDFFRKLSRSAESVDVDKIERIESMAGISKQQSSFW